MTSSVGFMLNIHRQPACVIYLRLSIIYPILNGLLVAPRRPYNLCCFEHSKPNRVLLGCRAFLIMLTIEMSNAWGVERGQCGISWGLMRGIEEPIRTRRRGCMANIPESMHAAAGILNAHHAFVLIYLFIYSIPCVPSQWRNNGTIILTVSRAGGGGEGASSALGVTDGAFIPLKIENDVRLDYSTYRGIRVLHLWLHVVIRVVGRCAKVIWRCVCVEVEARCTLLHVWSVMCVCVCDACASLWVCLLVSCCRGTSSQLNFNIRITL